MAMLMNLNRTDVGSTETILVTNFAMFTGIPVPTASSENSAIISNHNAQQCTIQNCRADYCVAISSIRLLLHYDIMRVDIHNT